MAEPLPGAESSEQGQEQFETAPILPRLHSFRFTYLAIASFIILYVFTVKGAEVLLESHFQRALGEALQIKNYNTPPSVQIKTGVDDFIYGSPWTRVWNVRVNVIVLARDGRTWLYVDGHAPLPPPDLSARSVLRQVDELLPATGEVIVSVPHNALLSNAILVIYAGLLLQLLFVYNRRMAKAEQRILEGALGLRDEAANRTASIEDELDRVRRQLLAVEPAEREQQDEIASLQVERASLQAKLANLARREGELRGKAAQAVDLEQERQALEDLLEEASSDLITKDSEIRKLEKNLKRVTKTAGGAGGRGRESDGFGKRMHTLYKNVEMDSRSISDLLALPDENTRLRAEECIKRLSEEADNVAVRRKVGGLPAHLSIYELGFAGKRRIYYMRGQQRRFRVLTIGAKNTQQGDLDYLARLPRAD